VRLRKDIWLEGEEKKESKVEKNRKAKSRKRRTLLYWKNCPAWHSGRRGTGKKKIVKGEKQDRSVRGGRGRDGQGNRREALITPGEKAPIVKRGGKKEEQEQFEDKPGVWGAKGAIIHE